MYHGHNAKPPFFEGWYFKLITADETQRYAVIPGVILGDDAHSFVQVLEGVHGETAYYRYPLEEFWASEREFELKIGPNQFNLNQIRLALSGESLELQGAVRFSGLTPWPVTLSSPGIMGWYAWAPRMECYHGVVSLDHSLQGSLQRGNQVIDFTGGRGYIEKDWGQAFPQAWVWFQSNHFEQPETCISASIATIPWMGSSFRGFIIGLWKGGILYRFATYTGAKTESLSIAEDHVDWVVSDRRHRLHLHAQRAGAGLLLGPTRLEMGVRVAETLNAQVEVQLATLGGEILFQGQGRHAGLEVHNTIALLKNIS